MSLDLSTINFSVNTKPLEAAAVAIGELVTNVGKLDKAARDAAQTEATLARAAKDNAKANLDNAKAQDVRLKSTITVDKADKANEQSVVKKTKAVESHTKATKGSVSILQRQTDIYNYQTQGFSKGQATILANAKATGQWSKQLEEILELQRQFSTNTFDKSETGLKRMVKASKEASDALGFLNEGYNLTSKQARELSNDLDRQSASLKQQGKSYQETAKEQAIYKQRFVEEANALNRATSALAEVDKQRKDVVSATNYLTQAEAKMAAALNTSNVALDKAGTDSLVKYEAALRKSGVSQDVATQKLATYKAQLAQVAAVEEKRRAQHLTRALTPQISDVAVSLWSGQSPLTVLLQQGSQINDMFQLSGVAAADFGKTVKEAFSSMLPSILTVVKGVGGLLVDGLTAAGNAVLGFAGKVTGMSGAIDGANKKLMDMGWTTAAAGVRGLGILMTTVFAAGAGAAVAGLVAIGVALKQVISENDKMAVSMGLTGAAMGLTFSTATDLSKSMQGIGVSASDAMQVLSEMAKQGKLTSNDVRLVTKAAVDMKTYAGVAIEDTVKQFVKMKEKPVEAMIELARATGLVAPEVVKAIMELDDQGKTAEATSRAIEELARVNDEQVERMKESYNGFSLFMIDLGKGISKFFSDAFKDLFYASSPTEQLKTQLKAVDETLNNWGTMNMDAVGAIQMLIPGEKERLQLQRTQLLNQIALLDQEKQQYEVIQKEKQDKIAMLGLERSVSDELSKRDLKRSRKKDNLKDFTSNFIEEKVKEVAKSKNLDIETIKSNDALMESYKKLAQVEWESAQEKTKKDPSENYFATIMREATAASIKAEDATKSLTASQVKLLEAVNDPRFLKLSKVQQEAYLSTMAANVATEQQTALTEKLAEAEEHRLKLLGKSEGIGKQYYSDMQKLEEFAKVAGWSREEIEELTRAVFKSTPAWKAYEKALEDVNSAARKFNEDSIASQAATLKENESLDYRLSLLGKTTEEQRALSIEYNRANKLSEVRIKLAKQLRDIEADIEKAKKAGLPEEKYKNLIDAQVQARKDAAEQEKVINREVAVAYTEDLQKEFDAIKNGVSDSIVTALFEGGKAGSKKIRDLVVAQLRKPVTMVVNAVVNTVFGSVIGSLLGGATASAAGSAGGSLLGSISSLSGLVSTANNLYSAITGGFANLSGSIATQVQSGLNFLTGSGGMISQGPIQVGGLAQGIGSVAAPLLGAYGGISAGRLIGGGYSLNGGSGNSTINLGTAVGSLFGPLGALAGGAIGGTVNRLFGRKLKESGIEGTFGGETGFEGRTYQYYKGGLFRSNKTKYGELDEETRSNFAKSFFDMKDGVSEMAKMLGLGTESLESFTYKFKVNLKGLSEEDATKKIQEQFKLMGEEMAKLVLTTDEYSLAEETRMDTLIRLSSTLSTVNTIFENMGMTMYDISLTGADAAYELSQLFGGLGQFTSVMSNYYDKFYSDSEKQILLQSQLDRAFKDLGVSVPKTRDEFRALVESQDLTTEEGRKLFAELMNLATGFDALASQAELLANARTDIVYRMMEQEALLLEAQGRTVEADKKRRELLDKQRGAEYERLMKINPELARLTAELWALEDAAVAAAKVKEIADTRQDLIDRILQQEAELLDSQGRTAEADKKRRELLDRQRARENERLMALNPELAKLAYELWLLEDATAAATRAAKERKEISNDLYNALVKAVDAEKKLLNEQKARLEETVSTLKAVFDILKSSVEDLYGEVSSTAAMQASEGRDVIAQAIATGILPDSKLLDTSIQAVRDEISNSLYVSKADADKARLIFAAQLALLKDTTEEQLTDAEKQLKALNRQIDYLDQVLKTAKDQLDAYLGNTEVLKTVSEALTDLSAFLQKPKDNGTGSKPTGTGSGGGSGGGAVFGPGGGGGSSSQSYSYYRPVGLGTSIGYQPVTDEATISRLDKLSSLYHSFDGTGDLVGLLNSIKAAGGTMYDLEALSGYWYNDWVKAGMSVGIPAFADGGNYRGGVALVGEEGPELINFSNPGQVYTARQTASMLSGESSEVVAELKAVRGEIIMLRAEVRADVSHNAKTAKLLDRVIPEGDSVQVTIS